MRTMPRVDDEASEVGEAGVWEVGERLDGARLDRAVAELAGVSTAAARRAIEQGRVRVDGRAAAKGAAVRAGQRVEVAGAVDDRAEPPRAWAGHGLTTLAEGPGWVAIDKPAGVAVHPLGVGQDRTLLNAVAADRPGVVGVGEGGLRSGVVHRLDVPTSGVVVFATEQATWERLRAAFAEHRVEKRYAAVVHGEVVQDAAEVRLRLAVRAHRPARVGVVGPGEAGYDCSLAYRVVERRGGRTLLDVDLHTGFLHQVRVTMAHLGHPVVGDADYGVADGAERLMLHAERVAAGDVAALSAAPFRL
ncbi:MAG: RluA family pseudouridine synthase [Planctomycetota bacterium]